MGTEHQIAHFLRELVGPAPERRAAAATGLGRIGRPEHAVVLVEAAADPDPAVRAAAAQGLGRLGVREAGRDVLPVLMGDANAGVRRRASGAAVRLGLDGRTVTEAFARLLRDPDRHVRINALMGLDASGVPSDIPALVALLGDPDGNVWGRARQLVHRFGQEPAMRAEVLRVAREGEGAARARALETLPAGCTERLLDSLLAGLRDRSPQVRIAAARRLADADPEQAGDALAAALESERHPDAAARLLIRLGERGDRRAIDPAVRWLRDPEAGPWAARALGDIGTRTAAAHLRTALDDETLSGATRGAAAKAVGESGGWDAVWLLLPLLDDSDAAVRVGAVDGLGALVYGGLRFWERHMVAWSLVAHLDAGRDDVWRTRNALDGLAQARPAVRRVADRTPSGEIRAAALSLLDIDDATGEDAREDVRRFVRGLDDPSESVRYHAALGLGRWVEVTGSLPPDSGGVPERLASLTADRSVRVRRAAAEVIGALERPTDS